MFPFLHEYTNQSFMEQITFEQYATFATIGLSIIAIIIAIWSSRQTSRQTMKQIDCLRQIALLQIDMELLQLEVEIFNAQIEEIGAKDEIALLRSEIEEMRKNPNLSEKQVSEFNKKIGLLSRNADMQRSWWFKLFNTQANLIFKSQRLK